MDLPYLAFGSLEQYLEERSLSIEEAKTIAVQVLLGVENLHENGIIHRDLKPSNILIDSIKLWLRIKVAHFGMAVMSLNARSTVGTSRFCAPEIYRPGRLTHYGMAVDIFSLGIVFLYMFGIELSYENCHSELDFNLRVGTDIERVISVAQGQEKVIALRTAGVMSTFEPKIRPTVAGCFDLPWFKQSQREWRPDDNPLDEAAAPPQMELPPRQRRREDSRDRSYQPPKKPRDSKLTARRRRKRHNRPGYKKTNYTEVSSSSSRLRR